jgi:hypothetical protein
MLRVNEMLVTGGKLGNAPVRLRTASGARACGVVAVLIAGSLFALPLWAQASVPLGRTAPAAPASTATTSTKPGEKHVVSPYARAARRDRAGQTPSGHAPTMVQGIGKTTHKPHAAAPRP